MNLIDHLMRKVARILIFKQILFILVCAEMKWKFVNFPGLTYVKSCFNVYSKLIAVDHWRQMN